MRQAGPIPASGSRLLLAALVLAVPAMALAATRSAAAARAKPARGPRIVLGSPSGGQREIAAPDLRFVYFKRTYYERRAPRADNPGGRRVEVEDRRAGCRCLRFEDWSRVRFALLRQIEISYPEAGRQAMVRFTRRNGQMHEVPAGAFFGAAGSLAPRFTATIEGSVREFPLVLGGGADERWPEDRLLRVILMPPPPTPPTPRHRARS